MQRQGVIFVTVADQSSRQDPWEKPAPKGSRVPGKTGKQAVSGIISDELNDELLARYLQTA